MTNTLRENFTFYVIYIVRRIISGGGEIRKRRHTGNYVWNLWRKRAGWQWLSCPKVILRHVWRHGVDHIRPCYKLVPLWTLLQTEASLCHVVMCNSWLREDSSKWLCIMIYVNCFQVQPFLFDSGFIICWIAWISLRCVCVRVCVYINCMTYTWLWW